MLNVLSQNIITWAGELFQTNIQFIIWLFNLVFYIELYLPIMLPRIHELYFCKFPLPHNHAAFV